MVTCTHRVVEDTQGLTHRDGQESPQISEEVGETRKFGADAVEPMREVSWSRV